MVAVLVMVWAFRFPNTGGFGGGELGGETVGGPGAAGVGTPTVATFDCWPGITVSVSSASGSPGPAVFKMWSISSRV